MRAQLEAGTPIKEVAWCIGYAHVSNFTTAFSAKFGVSPANYAKNR